MFSLVLALCQNTGAVLSRLHQDLMSSDDDPVKQMVKLRFRAVQLLAQDQG